MVCGAQEKNGWNYMVEWETVTNRMDNATNHFFLLSKRNQSIAHFFDCRRFKQDIKYFAILFSNTLIFQRYIALCQAFKLVGSIAMYYSKFNRTITLIHRKKQGNQ